MTTSKGVGRGYKPSTQHFLQRSDPKAHEELIANFRSQSAGHPEARLKLLQQRLSGSDGQPALTGGEAALARRMLAEVQAKVNELSPALTLAAEERRLRELPDAEAQRYLADLQTDNQRKYLEALGVFHGALDHMYEAAAALNPALQKELAQDSVLAIKAKYLRMTAPTLAKSLALLLDRQRKSRVGAAARTAEAKAKREQWQAWDLKLRTEAAFSKAKKSVRIRELIARHGIDASEVTVRKALQD